MPSSAAPNARVPETTGPRVSDPALAAAIDTVLETGVGLAEPDVLAVGAAALPCWPAGRRRRQASSRTT